MKRHLTGLLTLAAALLLAAPALRAQTPSPSPAPPPRQGEIYPSGKYPLADRLADAKAVIADPASSPEAVATATAWSAHLTLDTVNAANWPSVGAPLARQIIDAKGRLTPAVTDAQAADLLKKAHLKAATNGQPTRAATLDYLRPLLATYPDFSAQYGINALTLARENIASGRLTDALTAAQDPIVPTTNQWRNQIGLIADIKSRQRAADALGWAKLYYLLCDFSQTQDGIQAVTRALRAADLNLVRANAFIASETEGGRAPNLLAQAPLPEAYRAGLPAAIVANAPLVDQVIRGDATGALTAAMSQFVQAANNNDLNAAVAAVAQTLRNVDLNLIRANGFVSAQKQGADFLITELQ